jgi:hypothetical protein
MHYKSIVLELLQDRPELHRSLQVAKTLLPTLDRYAGELKASHEEWKDRLSQSKPGSDERQIASEALEIALKELEKRLPSGSPQDETEPVSLDEAMKFIRRHTPPA